MPAAARMPPHVSEKRLASGAVAWYWAPPTRDRRAGCPVAPEALGPDHAAARERAVLLNRHLAAWRDGRGAVRDLDHSPRFGTLAWLAERYRRSKAWDKVSARARPDYVRAMAMVLDIPLRNGTPFGDVAVTAVSARAVDAAYARLRDGPNGRRTRQAVVCVVRMARAWDVVARLYPDTVPAANPWRGVELDHGRGTTKPATRAEMMALHRALAAMGEAHLAAAPLICWEWLMRPENVVAGHFAWSAWKPADRPGEVLIPHHKTGASGWHRLAVDRVRLYPDLEDWLDALPRVGVPVVLMTRERHGRAGGWRTLPVPRPYRMAHVQRLVREARVAAGLGAHVTLAACRHGGMTELGDAGLTEQQTLSLSQHRTPEAARLYVKRTEHQRTTAALKRRQFVEGMG